MIRKIINIRHSKSVHTLVWNLWGDKLLMILVSYPCEKNLINKINILKGRTFLQNSWDKFHVGDSGLARVQKDINKHEVLAYLEYSRITWSMIYLKSWTKLEFVQTYYVDTTTTLSMSYPYWQCEVIE